MFYFISLFATLFHYYQKCPKCNRRHHFAGRTKGDIVRCITCGHEFVLK